MEVECRRGTRYTKEGEKKGILMNFWNPFGSKEMNLSSAEGHKSNVIM